MHAEVAAAAYVRLRRFRAERLRKQRVLRRNPANGQPHEPGRKRKWTDSLSSLSSLGNLSSSDLSDDEVAIDGSADDSEFEQSDSDVLSSSTTSDSDFAYSDWSDILGLNWRTRRSARGRSFNAGNHSSASEAAGLSPDSAESPSDVAMESDAPPRLIPVALLSLSSVSSHSDSDTSDADSGADGDFSESGSSSSIDTMSDDLAPSTLGRRRSRLPPAYPLCPQTRATRSVSEAPAGYTAYLR
ncbi:hypothetical protein BC629DRAFT_1598066 [Irpex lacteus]|nr:hypothetical protein BC629DRAFT_1598066 [Irpex lacteus]